MFTKRRNKTNNGRGTNPETRLTNSSNRGSLKNQIKYLHGESTLAKVNSFSKYRSSLSKHLSTLAFLKRCRDSNVVPKFLQLKNHLGTKRSKSILEKTGLLLVKERISYMKIQIHRISWNLFQLHLELSSSLRPDLWLTLDQISYEQSQHIHLESTQRQTEKYHKLVPQRTPPPPLDTVRNLSNKNFPLETISALSKGSNYAIVPTKIPKEEIISQIESSIYILPQEEADIIRRRTVEILRKSKLPTQNLSRSERHALKQLNKDPEIIILPADKGNTTVIMDVKDYDVKLQTQLTDDVYKKLTKDPTPTVKIQTTNLIKNSKLTDQVKSTLIPKNPLPPRLYGLPKIHKPDAPLRPIVSAISSPTYQLARYLARELQHLTGKTQYTIRNSSDFIQKIKKIRINSNDILISFDVVSLFTQVPLQDTLSIIKSSKQIPPDLIPLIEHCLNTTYFSYKNQFYKQTAGAAMGSPISPIIANIFMEHFEARIIQNASKKPHTWLRYVDDTFVIWQHGEEELQKFLHFLNTQHPNITFTMEMEQNGKLPFLDVLITRKPDGYLGHQVYRKPTHTNRYLHAMSHHHPSQKQSVLDSLTYRAFTICDKDSIQDELENLRKTLQQNGYAQRQINKTIRKHQTRIISNTQPSSLEKEKDAKKTITILPYIQGITDKIGRIMNKHNIRTIYKPPTKIGQFLNNPKDKRPSLSTPGVYKIPCSCGKVYIGETGRLVSTRVKEHEAAVRLKHTTQSALSEHQLESGHKILFDQTSILAKTNSYFPRKYRESLEIYKYPDNLNRDSGQKTSSIWQSILSIA